MILGVIGLSIGSVCLLFLIRNIIILCGFRKRNVKKTMAYLQKTEHKKNAYSGGKSGRFYKNWSDASYSYRVDGVVYTISDGSPSKPNEIPTSKQVIYQKPKPKRAYFADGFPMEWLCAAAALLMSLLFMILGILVLI